VTVTTPYALLKRIPEDQPFIVRNNPVKRLLVVGAVWVVLQLFLILCAVVALTGDEDPEHSHATTVFSIAVISLAFLSMLVSPIVALIRRDEPVLALGPAGLWVRTRPLFGQAIWLPWESLLLISRRRYGFDKMLIVRVRDERVAQLSQSRSSTFSYYGSRRPSGFMATLNMADRTSDEILQAVAYYSANRVPLT
jgi:hypothetical protein